MQSRSQQSKGKSQQGKTSHDKGAKDKSESVQVKFLEQEHCKNKLSKVYIANLSVLVVSHL